MRTATGTAELNGKPLRIIAKSLFRELKQNGYTNNAVIGLSGELLELVTADIREGNAQDDATSVGRIAC
jgi:hypothetical protein